MKTRSKRYQALLALVPKKEIWSIPEALEQLKKMNTAKFPETVELSIKLGIDPKKADQMVRGTVTLPYGIGKKRKILVFAKGEKAQEAQAAGADYVGGPELVAKVQEGWMDFDVVLATPDMMKDVSKLGKILGPRGLMPSPKSGTVVENIKSAVSEIQAGKIVFKNDAGGKLHFPVGKINFPLPQLEENIHTVIQTVLKAKPPAARGNYIVSAYLSLTMSPALKIQWAKTQEKK
ncbi:MAG: 50S ribosomal protein L1 [bacterium]